MHTVTSADGTPIAYTKAGSGPTVVLVGGGLDDGSENAPLADALAESFTAVNYARRGRPPSGDTAPYHLRREIEDLEALLAATASDPCHLYGVSSGGALALEAAAGGLPIRRLAVYEVPYSIGADAVAGWQQYVAELTAASGPSEMIGLFMRLAGSPEEEVARAPHSPQWPRIEPIGHTLAYDAACLGDGPPPERNLRAVSQPTLVATGAVRDPHMGNLRPGFFDDAADALAALLPDSERIVFEGQSHVADPNVVAPQLRRFFMS